MSIIEVENLSKKYRILHQKNRARYVTLRDELTNLILRPKKIKEDVWALKNVSFKVKSGEILGIIGSNGAGKTTLLKVLTRITPPTEGKVIIHGRVGSLLEVGTGFHPELTGRENIYLNGAILGMRKKEIKKKFDQIVDFAGIEKFLDTPVKRFSNGMRVRLAFSVAAYLEPDILLVDEVLSVGDVEFQKKCLGKMDEVTKKQGRTVLFVSHNMTSVKSLCSQAVVLKNGQVVGGMMSSNDAVNLYLGGDWQSRAKFISGSHQKPDAFIRSASITNRNGEFTTDFKTYEDIIIEINWVNGAGVKVTPNIMIVNRQGVTVMVATDAPIDFNGEKKKDRGVYQSKVKIPGNLLNANYYSISIALDCGSPLVCYDSKKDVLYFSVNDPMDENCIARGEIKKVREDAILWPALEWSYVKKDSI